MTIFVILRPWKSNNQRFPAAVKACRTSSNIIRHLIRSAGAWGTIAGRWASTWWSIAGWWAGVAGTWSTGRQRGQWDGVTAGTGTTRISRFLLSLVFDEVYFGFGWRGRRRGRYGDLWLVFGPLDQHVDQRFLGVLLDLWDDRGGRGRGSRGLDEDDFVMFLWRCDLLDLLRGDVFLFWGWHVHVDVFLDDRGGGCVIIAGAYSTRVATGATTVGVSGS